MRKLLSIIISVALLVVLLFMFVPRGISVTSTGWVSVSNYVYAHPALPTYEAFFEGKATSTSVDVAHSGIAADDILIGCLSSDGGSETHGSPDSDTWNDIYVGQSEGTGKATFSIWWKKATGSESSPYTFTCGSSEGLYAWVIRIDGADLSNPIHQQNIGTGDDTSATCPDVTTTVVDCLIIRAFGIDHIDVTVDGGWASNTNITVDFSNGSGGTAGGSAWENQAGIGSPGTEVNTLTGTEEWVAVTIAIQPPTGAVPDISNLPATWTLNGITGSGNIQIDTVYYANPLGDTTVPSTTVVDGECEFTLTNNSSMSIDLFVTMGNFSGGSDNMSNSDTGANGATSYGAWSWFSGDLYANKVIIKTSGSSVGKDGLAATTDIKWGAEVETQTNAWTGGNSSTATMTITAVAE